MTVKRYLKKCEEFMICAETGSAGDIFVDLAEENRTSYQIVIRGRGRGGKLFDKNYTEVDPHTNNFLDRRQYLGTNMIFESYEDYHIFGFNSLDNNIPWEGKLIKESFTASNNSWLICFDGRPIINGKELQRLDYAKLTNKWYDVEINDSIVGVFTKI